MNNSNLIVICITGISFFCFVMYFFAKGKKQVSEEEELASFEDILEALKLYIVDLIKED